MAEGYLYILSNSTRTLLYIGTTKNLHERLRLRERSKASVFTKKYHLRYLMYLEGFEILAEAFNRGRQIKKLA